MCRSLDERKGHGLVMRGQNIQGVTQKELVIRLYNPTIADTVRKSSALNLLNDTQMVLTTKIDNDVRAQFVINKRKRIEEIENPLCFGHIAKK